MITVAVMAGMIMGPQTAFSMLGGAIFGEPRQLL